MMKQQPAVLRKYSAMTLHFIVAPTEMQFCQFCKERVTGGQPCVSLEGVPPEGVNFPTFGHLHCWDATLRGLRPTLENRFKVTPIFSVANGPLLEIVTGMNHFQMSASDGYGQGLTMMVYALAAQADAWVYMTAIHDGLSTKEAATLVTQMRKARESEERFTVEELSKVANIRSVILRRIWKAAESVLVKAETIAIYKETFEEYFDFVLSIQ